MTYILLTFLVIMGLLYCVKLTWQVITWLVSLSVRKGHYQTLLEVQVQEAKVQGWLEAARKTPQGFTELQKARGKLIAARASELEVRSIDEAMRRFITENTETREETKQVQLGVLHCIQGGRK